MSCGRLGGAHPPVKCTPEEFDLWCHNMHERGYSVEMISMHAGVSYGRVRGALRRVECGRYGEEGGGHGRH